MDETDKVGTLRDAVRALDAADAPSAVIGGVAVGLRSGIPRATLGTDLAVISTVDRATVVRALVDAGFSGRGAFAHGVNFRHPSGEPVQIVFDREFDPMIERAELLQLGGMTVRVVVTSDLIAMKGARRSRPCPAPQQGAPRCGRCRASPGRRAGARRGLVSLQSSACGSERITSRSYASSAPVSSRSMRWRRAPSSGCSGSQCVISSTRRRRFRCASWRAATARSH